MSRHGHAFIDRALWTDDPTRMTAAHVPAKTSFATKTALACAMIERTIAAKVSFGWVAADSVYGVGAVETVLRRAGKGYVLGVSSDRSVHSWGKARPIAGTAGAIVQDLPASDWRRLSAGEGTKGARLHDWAYLELADLDASEYGCSHTGLSERLPLTINVRSWTRGLLIRRNIADSDLAFFSTWCPAGTAIETLVRIEGHRWAIEDSFETAKNELGLDHNQTRFRFRGDRLWHGWHRHVSLVMHPRGRALGRQNNNPRLLTQPMLRLPRARLAFELCALRVRQNNRGHFMDAIHRNLESRLTQQR